MTNDTITQESFLTLLSVKLNTDYTEEQKALISAFGEKPIFCFADPGTGKTFTSIGGIINSELYKRIPGDQIYALSFTRLATSELAVRHERACKKLRIVKKVNFTTLHALCKRILEENYKLLGMTTFQCGDQLPIDRAISIIENLCAENGWTMDLYKQKAVYYAINEMNSSLVFDQDNVMSKFAFKELGIEYEIFDKIRGALLSYSLLTQRVAVSDILIYTLLLLTEHPEVADKFKEKCKLMLVDEAQDLSLIQLRIISKLTDHPVLIGDMKQQIYTFNGACPDVVSEFYRFYPNAQTYELTQSFRCKNEIADYATRIILPNEIGGENFKGTGDGGTVREYSGYNDTTGLDLDAVADKIKDSYLKAGHKFEKDILFLYRNNIFAIPVVEALFKRGLPFRSNNFAPAYTIPLIKELCELLRLCESPKSYSDIGALRYVIPEFRQYVDVHKHPLYVMGTRSACSIFEINYEFRDPAAGKAMTRLFEVSEMIKENVPVKDLLNHLWGVFYEAYVKNRAWMYDMKPEYYINSISCLTHKNYTQFMQDEMKKQEVLNESERYSRGPRCYTMHASKGLEADVVYILNADTGIIPNESKIKRMAQHNCYDDVIRSVREDRSLCYVAATRAKEELHIIYTSELSLLFHGEKIEQDIVDTRYSYDDVTAFSTFAKRYLQI